MAARWGAGEETLTACNMDFFSMDTLDETDGLSPAETLEALQSCLDPSILSIFEDTPTIETKGLDEESDATLLTALTEILDNVDDENLSPFDTLPDSDLLSGQKGREHSPLRRLLCLSRSPLEKDTLCGTRAISTGKSLPRMLAEALQRSDGEEEEDLSLSPASHDSYPDSDQLHWEGLALPLPVNFEQEVEDGVSVSLGDLVRHMHPYCMAISMENEEGEQMLPEGGILLEVVDQGENGEPILAIPDMDLSVSLPLKDQFSETEHKVSEEADEVASDSSEHIVVDDEDETPVKAAALLTPALCSDVKDNMIIKKQKEEGSSSHRKKKRKCREERQPKPVEGRVLRSGTVRKTAPQSPKKPEKRPVKEEKKKHKSPKVLQASTSASSSLKPKKPDPCHTETQKLTTTTLLPKMNVQVATSVSTRQEMVPLNASPEKSQPSCSPTTVISQKPEETPQQLSQAPEKLEGSTAAPSAVLPPPSSESPAAVSSLSEPQLTPVTPVSEAPPPVAPAVSEPKPKSLSLAEYRRLRQQKRPAPVEKQENNSTRWPSLPELPKELPPIPCLPDPSPKDLRRPNPQAAVEEIRPAWQPRGPCAPPTPEALLVPPAYMAASSSKVTPVPKPQQKPEPSKTLPSQKPPTPSSNSVRNLPSQPHTAAQPVVPCVPQSSGSLASLRAIMAFVSSANVKCPPAPSGGKSGVDKRPQSQFTSLESVALTKACLKTTTDTIKPNAATVSVPRAPQKTIVFQKVPVVTAPAPVGNPIIPESKTSKPTAYGTHLCIPPATHPSDSQSQKAQPVVLETKDKPTTAVKPQKAKSPTQELIEAFTTEIGIEAADLTSLLEQFEETQAKEEQSVLEVSGRAAAVGNSSVELAPEKTVVERVRANDLSSTAALTPPATPPHHMWKPLAPVALLGKSKAAEASKPSPSKVIQIEARPLPSLRSRSKPTPAAAAVAPELACMDHDYCLPNKGASTGEPGKRWNVKQPSFITIKPIGQPTRTTTQTPPAAPASSAQSAVKPVVAIKTQEITVTEPLDHRTDGMERSSVLETPDASPAQQDTDASVKEGSPRSRPCGRSYRRPAASRTPSPRSSPKERTGGRSRKRRCHRSPSPMSSSSESDSNSSRARSRSHSPSKKRYRLGDSDRSSSSSSRSSSRSSPSVSRSPPRRRRYSYSSSHSGSWSHSSSRSRSPQRQWSRSRRVNSYGQSTNKKEIKPNSEEVKRLKEKAIEERRVVYIGRIRGTMTQKELKERFSMFGEIEECTLHFRDHGDNYGFVTYYDTKNAFTAIENGSKLRKPDELPFDLCFGGRRQFCKSNYADLDSSREYDPLPAKGKFHALDFDTLLKQAKQNQKR
ncbi:peroxisome proliferator-activated receptor gamma coactivator-related protein 1 [Anoplopoma fimbria]|uniref:peroxisome proliferator-activated receptor gamma coactivator-related protein 1 n=1 Tax=Anoplopoma fimbria TaxID=229290 RepID=UPI0023EA7EEF|nr:peroxisome proliferator-activated receptor gamma coactivator-related protein 1 [Anoplopoma fimbria]